jgi:hypothetical protein
MVDSALLNNNYVIQSILQKADELTKQPFGLNSTLTVVGEEQYSTTTVSNTNVKNSSDLSGLTIQEIDEATANQILQSLSTANVSPQYHLVNGNNAANVAVGASTALSSKATNYTGELFQDPNPPRLIRRPAAQGPLTYRQNVSVRFLQPPPIPPPGVSFTCQNNLIHYPFMLSSH